MELSNKPHVSSLKRKRCDVCKIARVNVEHNLSFHSSNHSYRCFQARPNIAESCSNFLNSGSPRRVMFLNSGDWLDFSDPVLETLIKGFRDGKSSVKFPIGGKNLLLDYVSMVVIDLTTRKQRSVAWIDEADKCFFPTFFFDEEADESTDWVLQVTGKKPHVPEVGSACGSPPHVVKRVAEESGASVLQQVSTQPKSLATKVEKLKRDSDDFMLVQKLFLAGMGPFATPQNIVHIHKHVQKDNVGRMRMVAFENQMSSTRRDRGDANLQYGWFGSKKADIIGILVHGFGMAEKSSIEAVCGTGIYLTPENRVFSSVSQCDVDDKGMQYMMLCRVILGNMEQVQPGSKQHIPSTRDYDSGVDDLLSPKYYVVWPTHMNSYIHPEYVISFMLAPKIREYLFGLKDLRFHVPNPKHMQDFSVLHPVRFELPKGTIYSWMPIPMLFESIQDSVHPVAKELLYRHYEELQCKKITREELIEKMRLIVGDQLLLSTLKRLKLSPGLWGRDSGEQGRDSGEQKVKHEDAVADEVEPDESETAPPMTDLNDSAASVLNKEMDDYVAATILTTFRATCSKN